MTGPVTAAVADEVAACGYADDDPRTIMGVVALKLAAEYDRAPREALYDEIARLLPTITALPGEPSSVLEQIQARVAVKMANLLLNTQITDVPAEYRERS